jgi:hypothetical protein
VLVYVPTAKQCVVPMHDTDRRALKLLRFTFGLVTIDHAVPFHRSVKVRVCVDVR